MKRQEFEVLNLFFGQELESTNICVVGKCVLNFVNNGMFLAIEFEFPVFVHKRILCDVMHGLTSVLRLLRHCDVTQ